MIFDPIAAAWKDGDLDAVLEAFAGGKQVFVSGLKGSVAAFYLTMLQQHLKMPIAVVTPNTGTAEDLLRDITFFSQYLDRQNDSSSRIVYFPSYDAEPYQGVSPHPQISAMRMQALWHLSRGEVQILILPITAAIQIIAPPENFSQSMTLVKSGETRSPLEMVGLLNSYGYKEKDLVSSKGEFSLRGGILDFYSPAEELPLRLEFFGNRIDSMRTFEANTQRSVMEVESAAILGLREIFITGKEIDAWGEFSRKRWLSEFHYEELLDKTEQLMGIGAFDGFEEFACAFFPNPSTILDYLPKDTCLVLEDAVTLANVCEQNIQDFRKRYDRSSGETATSSFLLKRIASPF